LLGHRAESSGKLEVAKRAVNFSIGFWKLSDWTLVEMLATSETKDFKSASFGKEQRVCKIWDFQGVDNKERFLLGYKNPVRTSQETRYISAIEPTRLMLRKAWGFHFGNYEECHHLGFGAMWLFYEPWFRKSVSLPSSEWKESLSRNNAFTF
jgi:hypothetical protein